MKRTLNTALLGFGQDIDQKGLKIIALPELQETSDLPCDTGSAPEELAKEFEGKPVDFQLVHPDWNVKKGKFGPAQEALNARAREARLWLLARPEKEIVVVTHGTPISLRAHGIVLTAVPIGAFLHLLTDDWSDSARFNGTGWANTEFRSYTFASTDKEHEPVTDAHMVETEASRLRRHPADTKPLSREEQAQAKAATQKEWQGQGYAEPGKAPDVKAKI